MEILYREQVPFIIKQRDEPPAAAPGAGPAARRTHRDRSPSPADESPARAAHDGPDNAAAAAAGRRPRSASPSKSRSRRHGGRGGGGGHGGLHGAAPPAASSASASAGAQGLHGTAASGEVRERHHPSLTLQIARVTVQHPYHGTALAFQITDEADPFFLYSLTVSEEAFHVLKHEQALLVDFPAFPGKVIELLNLCRQAGTSTHPSFVAQLVVPGDDPRLATFQLVETNSFKNITHLRMNVVPGTDAMLNDYLAGVVQQLKAERVQLTERLHASESQRTASSSETQARIAALEREVQTAREAAAEAQSKQQLTHSETLARIREDHLTERATLRDAHAAELKALRERLEAEIQTLTSQNAALHATQAHLRQHTASLEKHLAGANRQIEHHIKDVTTSQQAAARAAEQLADTASRLDAAQATVAERDAALAQARDVEQTLRGSVERLEERIAALTDQRATLGETCDVLRAQAHQTESALRAAEDDVAKGNAIIRKLQAELKSARAATKLKAALVTQHEALLEERRQALAQAHQDLTELKAQLAAAQHKEQTATTEREALQSQLADARKSIEDNTHVIEWLHKQLNEDALRGPTTYRRSATALAGAGGSPSATTRGAGSGATDAAAAAAAATAYPSRPGFISSAAREGGLPSARDTAPSPHQFLYTSHGAGGGLSRDAGGASRSRFLAPNSGGMPSYQPTSTTLPEDGGLAGSRAPASKTSGAHPHIMGGLAGVRPAAAVAASKSSYFS
ncbi:hypothetical protein CXG81DRAFT_20194 [Caulochytrium protostelioides]|uniref:Spindle assembly abnormal protein 6 N-terminal domain-containing protein n=1 Tax=Caulochytrium protostelioides TaxID=1555241 RepID=A0A4P9X3Y0_9FUNG|nr:hypothetical protein CXG81DRAFT_20194 [Caulochytrium protostelioides]|eukprot:RKO99757.1 hypothetical protein CXG81DRAFT_20194 [Caulochytrium protostelioides]